MQGQLDRKDRECEAKTKEKDELMKTLNILKEKLDAETKDKAGVSQKLTEMIAHADQLRQTVSLVFLLWYQTGTFILSFDHYFFTYVVHNIGCSFVAANKNYQVHVRFWFIFSLR